MPSSRALSARDPTRHPTSASPHSLARHRATGSGARYRSPWTPPQGSPGKSFAHIVVLSYDSVGASLSDRQYPGVASDPETVCTSQSPRVIGVNWLGESDGGRSEAERRAQP